MPPIARTSEPPDQSSPERQQAYMEAFRARQRQAGIRRVSATFSAPEYERLAESAQAHGEKITAHHKTLALAHLDNRYLVPPDMTERADALLSVLRGVGNNLNQLARYSNEMRYFLDTEEVRLQIKRLTEEVKAFIEQPGQEKQPNQQS
jgi:nitrate reductase beta subunit